MKKYKELSDPTSYLNRARSTELIFVLLGRDLVAPYAIRAWADERVRLGYNKANDAQIREALNCAERMERRRAK
jgi:hypothetical protein